MARSTQDKSRKSASQLKREADKKAEKARAAKKRAANRKGGSAPRGGTVEPKQNPKKASAKKAAPKKASAKKAPPKKNVPAKKNLPAVRTKGSEVARTGQSGKAVATRGGREVARSGGKTLALNSAAAGKASKMGLGKLIPGVGIALTAYELAKFAKDESDASRAKSKERGGVGMGGQMNRDRMSSTDKEAMKGGNGSMTRGGGRAKAGAGSAGNGSMTRQGGAGKRKAAAADRPRATLKPSAPAPTARTKPTPPASRPSPTPASAKSEAPSMEKGVVRKQGGSRTSMDKGKEPAQRGITRDSRGNIYRDGKFVRQQGR